MAETNETTPTSGGERTRRSRRPTSTYVLQAPRMFDDVEAWVDVTIVTVPATTRRVTAYRKAVAAWGATIPEAGVELRLIPEEHAKSMLVAPEPPEPPKLRIG